MSDKKERRHLSDELAELIRDIEKQQDKLATQRAGLLKAKADLDAPARYEVLCTLTQEYVPRSMTTCIPFRCSNCQNSADDAQITTLAHFQKMKCCPLCGATVKHFAQETSPSERLRQASIDRAIGTISKA